MGRVIGNLVFVLSGFLKSDYSSTKIRNLRRKTLQIVELLFIFFKTLYYIIFQSIPIYFSDLSKILLYCLDIS